MGSRKRRRSSSSSSASEDDEEKRTLFVANLHPSTTEEIFFELFLQAGPIESVRIPKEKETNRQKTFGFITYKYSCAVPYALKLYDGIKLFGRNLTIRAREVKENKDSQNSRNFNRNPSDSRNSSLRYGFKDKLPDMSPKVNSFNRVNDNWKNMDLTTKLQNLNQFAPELVDGIKGSFQNPFKASGSRQIENHRNEFKHSSRNETRSNNRDAPYNRPSHNDRKRHQSHWDDRRSEQRKKR